MRVIINYYLRITSSMYRVLLNRLYYLLELLKNNFSSWSVELFCSGHGCLYYGKPEIHLPDQVTDSFITMTRY